MIRVAVLYFAKPSQVERLKKLSEALAKGLQKQGAMVDVINGLKTRDTKLTGYHYVVVGCDVRSWFRGLLPPELPVALANSGIISGKKSFAFVPSAPLGASTTLLKLMRAMEHEGMMVRFSEVLTKVEDAEAVGQRLKLG